MRTVNKIRERDMDPSFLLNLINDAQHIDVNALMGQFIRRDERILRTMLPTDYVNEVATELQNLWAAIDNIEDNYRKNSVAIKKKDLDNNLQDIIDGMSYFLQKVRTQDDHNPIITYNENGERIIIVTDAQGNEYNVVIPSIYDLENGLNSIDKARFQGQLDILNTRVNQILSTITVLQRQVNNIRTTGIKGSTIDLSGIDLTDVDNEALEQLLTIIMSQEKKIKDLEDILNDTTDEGNDFGSTINDIQSDITNLYDKVNRKIKLTNLDTELQSQLNQISDLVRRVSDVENSKMEAPILSEDGYLYYCASQGKLVKARPPVIKATVCDDSTEVVVAQDNRDPFIINLETGKGYQYNKASRVYDIVEVAGNTLYDNLLILNLATEKIEYFILEGTILRLDSLDNSGKLINSAHLTVKRFDIAAGDTVEIQRLNNLKKFPPLVLVYDYENNSRTVGRYINGEGVITISHNSDGFKLHNDHEYELEVMVMVGD